MKCQSCNEDIPTKFQHALSINSCPYCGKPIMDEKLQTIIGELKVAFDDAKDHMSQIEDWLFSNYNLKVVKQGEVIVSKDQLKSFSQIDNTQKMHNPGISVRRLDDESKEDVMVDAPKTVFARRAGIITAKRAVDVIRGKAGRTSGAADPSEFIGEDEEYGNDEIFMSEASSQKITHSNSDNPLNGLFDNAGLNKTSQELEIEKLKKMHQRNDGGFRRGE